MSGRDVEGRPEPGVAHSMGDASGTVDEAARLRRLALSWAESQPLAQTADIGERAAAPLLARLQRLTAFLADVRRHLTDLSRGNLPHSYAAEWFLDNYHLVRDSLRQVRHDLPVRYYAELPKLAGGAELAGLPRVYALARALIEESDAQLDPEHMTRLVAAYQSSAPLTMGELWALPTMLRVGLLERLSESLGRLTNPQGPRISASAEPPDQRVANCIVGLRAVKTHDWRRTFESLSLVEHTLRQDPGAGYATMDFETRDRYRKVVERVARRARVSELEVAQAAVRLATEAPVAGGDAIGSPRRSHVGYYLIAEGLSSLHRQVGYRPSPRERAEHRLFANAAPAYLGGVGLLTLAIVFGILRYAVAGGAGGWAAVVAILLSLVPALTIAVGVVNLIVNHLVPPRTLPKLDFRRGIPDACSAAVVVPALITSEAEVAALLGRLEKHSLGNPEPQLSFALLTDFADAPEATQATDEALLRQAIDGVRALNDRYGARGTARFYLLHRERRWNPSEGVWMGWERKRGKLTEFNRLLRGDTTTSFVVQVGDLSRLAAVHYVLTLDADTRLPPDTAQRLLGTLAHPLNRAEFDAEGRLVAGYSVLQPRTEILPESANRSRFSRLFVGDNGLDLYTLAVSDVYQDLFGQGIYVGKGLYRVDDFSRALEGRVPDNAVLSHDLLEGLYGGVGLVTDVVLFEEYPPNYLARVLRSQRWVRGDWQLLPWLVPALRGRDDPAAAIGAMGKWKIFDNLRRSLLMPALLLLFVLGWTWLPPSAIGWTLFGLLSLALPLLGGAIATVTQGLAIALGNNGRALIPWRPLTDGLRRYLVTLSFLPFEAPVVAGSIGVTLHRLLVTRRHLLRWRTAALTDQLEHPPTVLAMAGRLTLALGIALGVGVLVVWLRPSSLPAALPVIALWLASPWIAYSIGRRLDEPVEVLDERDREHLRAVARRTWLYFERFVGPEDNWLPPDNVQEAPTQVTAHRTSPTNIGLMLLSTMAAHDLGYLGTLDLSLRLRQTLDVLDKMERYRGHLLNWYDTRSLQPLAPRYVSTVDSGNLAGSLIALRQGSLEQARLPVLTPQRWRGLIDALSVLSRVLHDLPSGRGRDLERRLEEVRRAVIGAESDPLTWSEAVRPLTGPGWHAFEADLIELMDAAVLPGHALTELRLWSERVRYNLRVTQREFEFLLPWIQAFEDASPWTAALPEGSDARAAWASLRETLDLEASLDELPAVCAAGRERTEELRSALHALDGQAVGEAWCEQLARQLLSAEAAAKGLLASFASIAEKAEANLAAMDFRFLYDPERQLLHIGYNVDSERLDDNDYDLLASEVRIASLVAIAKNDLPVSHWLHLGRPIADVGGRATLLSWSGTMFEYLMPDLLTRRFTGSLLAQSSQSAVAGQIAYARRRGVPWGISESGFARVDASGTYQYRAFGVPELAIDRSQGDDLVIAPYASLLALSLRPKAVMTNLGALEDAGALSPYGFFEALDYTPSRRPLAADAAVVRSHMAHHQGMILVSLANTLTGDAMVRRFHADPRIATVELLLQERIPTQVPVTARPEEEPVRPRTIDTSVAERPWSVDVDTDAPAVHVLSNGHYTVLLSAAGSGYSTAGETAITRWSSDTTLDDQGSWIYVRDLDAGTLASAARQPLGTSAEPDEVLFHPHMVEFRRGNDGVHTALRVTVADLDAELRELTITNQSERPRSLEITSYAEVVLAPQASDQRHPAFSKLFVESEYLPDLEALFYRRRPRASDERPVYAAHMLVAAPRIGSAPHHESDRARFVGRGRTPRDPLGPLEGLSGTTGATLDPIMAISKRIVLGPHSRATLTYVTATAPTRVELLATLKRLRSPGMVGRSFEAARARTLLEMRRNDLSVDRIASYQALLSALLYPSPAMRAPEEVLASNRLGQSALWGQAISGDFPILLVRVKHQEETPLVTELIRAHSYWRRRGLKVDLVVLNTKDSAYDQELQGQLRWVLSRTGGDDWLNARGGIFLLRADQLAPADRVLLDTAARVVLDGGNGDLTAQLGPLRSRSFRLPRHVATVAAETETLSSPPRPTDLLFDNGIGGFTPDGRAYVTYVEKGRLPPAPWSNVIANEDFGFLVTEGGMGASWAINSGENRLTPWTNDPVSDLPAEVVYLRDEETAELWSATPQPCGTAGPTIVRHGAGYSSYEREQQGVGHVMRTFAAANDPVKVVHLRVTNLRQVPRRLTVTYYAPWVLGVLRSDTQPFVIPEYSADHCALLATNPYNEEFGSRVAFLASNKTPHGVTTDRTEFLGRLGSLAQPAGLQRIGLSGTVRSGVDPCAVLQLHLDLDAEGSEEVVFVLGQAEGRDEALRLADAYRDVAAVPAAFAQVEEGWDARLESVRITTPDAAMNMLLNRWALYQTLSCRIWGRTAFYQSSGAYGFRDQLQDVMAVLHVAPDVARRQILRACSHQFEEGDVLHWWHPPTGRGVRTRISDDLLWLPYVTSAYVEATGDRSVLEERLPFLRGEPLAPDEHERYGAYAVTQESATVLEHCRRAIAKGATTGPRGLPLMGGGDWNDGMNRVGIEGRGESVWLGWFLIATLKRFADLCERSGETHEAESYRARAESYRDALENSAWDGDWYLRAFYDDGTTLGSHLDQECRIDSIAQSWSVLSGGADKARARRAMDSVDALLVDEDDALIRLFTPAFDKTVRDPGYVKGYLPGVRENGGQYTHGALWTAWAFAELGEGDRAGELFRLLNPVLHGGDAGTLRRYKVEPYVIAADVYSLDPHVGRGGWTWYTGSAGWVYRLGLEGILGVRRVAEAQADGSVKAGLRIEPCIPSSWPSYTVEIERGGSSYQVEVVNEAGVCGGVREVRLDGETVVDGFIPMEDDGRRHQVRVVLG